MMYSSIYQFLRKYVLPGHGEIRRCLRELESTQWLPRAQLEELQLQKIKRLVNYAYENVPYYRRRYKDDGIHPRDIKSLKDFESLPFLTRDDVNNHREELVATGYQGKVLKGKTSGSTGRPMRFIMDRTAAYWSYAFETRCRGWYGVRPGNKMAWITGTLEDYNNWNWKDRLAANIKRFRYINARTMNESAINTYSRMLVKWQPTILRVYPSSLAIFTHYLKEHGITNITAKIIETTAEKTMPAQKKLFEEVFKASVVDHYSSLEIFSYAYQCPEGGLHVSEERYLELVEHGRVVEDGTTGEVIVTALNQYAMPFIRYKNGDVGIYESGSCSCGRGMPVLREVTGRNCDVLIGSDGKSIHWTLVSELLESHEQIYQYQIYQPDKEHLELRLVCKADIDSTLLENIRIGLQPFFGESMDISFKLMDRIELTPGGKHSYVISRVKPDSSL